MTFDSTADDELRGQPVAAPLLDEAALLDEALKKSGLIWVGPTVGSAKAVWHVWDGGRLYLLCGGSEQAAPVAAGEPAVVIARSKDKGVRLVTVESSVEQLPQGEEWDRIASVMQAKRLNSPDGDAAPQRWKRESVILRLTPATALAEAPGRYASTSAAATPRATDAGTRVPRPWHLFGRTKR